MVALQEDASLSHLSPEVKPPPPHRLWSTFGPRRKQTETDGQRNNCGPALPNNERCQRRAPCNWIGLVFGRKHNRSGHMSEPSAMPGAAAPAAALLLAFARGVGLGQR